MHIEYWIWLGFAVANLCCALLTEEIRNFLMTISCAFVALLNSE